MLPCRLDLKLLLLLIQVEEGIRFALEQVWDIYLASLTIEDYIVPTLEPGERVSIALIVGHQIKEPLAAVFVRPEPFSLPSHCPRVFIIALLHCDISLCFL